MCAALSKQKLDVECTNRPMLRDASKILRSSSSDLADKVLVRLDHCHGAEELLQVVRQIRPPCVPFLGEGMPVAEILQALRDLWRAGSKFAR